MRVRVEGDLNKLVRDYTRIAFVQAPRDMNRVVEHNVNRGRALTQGIARKRSGPHGALYYKRITSEMTGAFEGEYGPEGVVANNAVGAGWRNGPGNTDLEKSQDIIGPAFAKMLGVRVGRWSW